MVDTCRAKGHPSSLHEPPSPRPSPIGWERGKTDLESSSFSSLDLRLIFQKSLEIASRRFLDLIELLGCALRCGRGDKLYSPQGSFGASRLALLRKVVGVLNKAACLSRRFPNNRPKRAQCISLWQQLMTSNARRSIQEFLAPLTGLPDVERTLLGTFEVGGETYSLPRFRFCGPNASEPIRIGLFAAIHGDEPAGALAAAHFLIQMAQEPALAENFLLQMYPLCNPTGFEDNTRESRRG